MPPRWVLLLLLGLATLPPFVARAAGSRLFAFGMFTRVERYHLDVVASTPEQSAAIALVELGPHLSRDARRIILPARGYAAGQEQIDLLVGGLEDLGALVCALRPRATRVRLTLVREPMQPGDFVPPLHVSGTSRQTRRHVAEALCPPSRDGGPRGGIAAKGRAP